MAIEDSSEASLLGIKVSVTPVLGAIKVFDVVMLIAFEEKADRISRASENAKSEQADYIKTNFRRVADVVP